jgi:hypothetical protein
LDLRDANLSGPFRQGRSPLTCTMASRSHACAATEWAHPCHICAGTEWAHPCHICAGTEWAHPCHICAGTAWAHPCHICAGTGWAHPCHMCAGSAWVLCGYSPAQVRTLHAVAASHAEPVAGRTVRAAIRSESKLPWNIGHGSRKKGTDFRRRKAEQVRVSRRKGRGLGAPVVALSGSRSPVRHRRRRCSL